MARRAVRFLLRFLGSLKSRTWGQGTFYLGRYGVEKRIMEKGVGRFSSLTNCKPSSSGYVLSSWEGTSAYWVTVIRATMIRVEDLSRGNILTFSKNFSLPFFFFFFCFPSTSKCRPTSITFSVIRSTGFFGKKIGYSSLRFDWKVGRKVRKGNILPFNRTEFFFFQRFEYMRQCFSFTSARRF